MPELTTETLSAEQLIERARELIPIVRERAPIGEENRSIPPETVEDFKKAGIVRALTPERFGGHGLELPAIFEAAMEIARGDGSSAWLASFYGIHNYQATWFGEEAQSEYFAEGPDTISCTIPAYAQGDFEEVDGGLLVSGRWKFSSGVNYATWAFLHTPDATCLVPRSDFEVIDEWFVEGLRGTGSNGTKMDKVFIPEHRIVKNEALMNSEHPGAALSDSPWHHITMPALYAINHGITSPIIGMAHGVLDIFDERAQKRLDSQVFLPAIERPGPQLRFAEASMEIDLAKLLLRENYATARDWGVRRYKPTMEERAKLRRNIVYPAHLATRAVNRLVEHTDSSSLHQSAGIHRLARDARAGGLQFINHWEETAMQYSRLHWGLETISPII